MSKHIADSERIVSGSARFGQFVRIDINGRPSLQSKVLQQRTHSTDPNTYTRRFLQIDRRKDT